MKKILVLCLSIGSLLTDNAFALKLPWQTGKKPKAETPALTLQQQVSHPRGTDQISLVFKKDVVELRVNTSGYQKDKAKPRLGLFMIEKDSEMQTLEQALRRYASRIKQFKPLISVINNPRFQAPPSPHAPFLRLNGVKLSERHPHFQNLSAVIYAVWDKKWTCLYCARYTRHPTKKNLIVRTVTDTENKTSSPKSRPGGKKALPQTDKQLFTKDFLNCVSKGSKKTECVDPDFGIFLLH